MAARFDAVDRHIVTASMDGAARVWDVKACEEAAETCEPLQTLRGHRKDVTSAMFSADGQHVLTTANDKTVRIWDWRKGTTLVGLQGPSGSFGWVSRAFFDPAEERLLTTFGGAAAYLWDLKAYDAMAPAVLRGHTDVVKFAGFNVTGDRVVTASLDKTARVWDLSKGSQVHQLEHDDPVFSAAFDPTGRWIITAAGDAAHIWDQSTGKRVRSLAGHKSGLCSAAFAPVGDQAVTASMDGTARIWNGETLRFTNEVQHRYVPELRWASIMDSSILTSGLSFPGIMMPGKLRARLRGSWGVIPRRSDANSGATAFPRVATGRPRRTGSHCRAAGDARGSSA